MKKTIVLTILILKTLCSISQTTDSITCIPNSKLRKVIKELENAKIMKQELELTQKSVSILENRIQAKDSIITRYEGKDKLCEERCNNYDNQILNLKDQITNEKKISSLYKLKVNTLKIGKWLYGAGGLAIGILIMVIK